MALLTPVVKAFLTDRGYKGCNDALQVFGGSGYVEEWGMSQFVRDSRIALIYEGTNGVQALDLVGRKLAMNGMRPIQSFFAEIDAFIADHQGDEELKPYIDGLIAAKADLDAGTNWLMHNGLENPDNAGAASTDYLHIFGFTAFAYMWAMMAKASFAKLKEGDDPFYANKLKTGRYFLTRLLPETAVHLRKLEAGAEPMMALEAEAF